TGQGELQTPTPQGGTRSGSKGTVRRLGKGRSFERPLGSDLRREDQGRRTPLASGNRKLSDFASGNNFQKKPRSVERGFFVGSAKRARLRDGSLASKEAE